MFEKHMEVAELLLTAQAKLLPVLDLSLFCATTKLLGKLKTNLHAHITGEDKTGKCMRLPCSGRSRMKMCRANLNSCTIEVGSEPYQLPGAALIKLYEWNTLNHAQTTSYKDG
ncbi:hypothetical protein E2C01_054051 [Portunus trituberculatus]|uniref:Uncharacterized protein n=1 Tax=Portunus trituberculatus TaxID=210409 RepID=A0A5B7GQX4_PORTR|nr:hypothetical protein [Portunus trituberculatus]